MSSTVMGFHLIYPLHGINLPLFGCAQENCTSAYEYGRQRDKGGCEERSTAASERIGRAVQNEESKSKHKTNIY